MRNVNKGLLIFCCLLAWNGFAQSTSEKLKKEQQQLEQKIASTKSLLDKTKTNTAATFNELKLINSQIKYREELLRNYDNQIRSAELKIAERNNQIKELELRIEKLKDQYKQLLVYAYKHRNKYGDMMYIISSDSYYEAIKRNKYLEKIQEIQQKQFLIIGQHKKIIALEIEAIEKERQHKYAMIGQKKQERERIAIDKVEKEQLYKTFQSQEQELIAKLKEEERQRANLKAKIDAAIKKEIAEAEARRKKAEAEALRKAKEKGETNVTAKEVEKAIEFAETKEAAALSKSFEGNRGNLPWPVQKGTITEGFGKNPHPTLENVYTNNNGIDISSPKNAQVRVVFEGEVTSVLNIPGAGKVIIVKHGNYRTVYSNLQNVYVSKGSKVTTKQVIGSLLTKDGQSISIAHFEIHLVNGASVQCLNPTLWVSN